MPRPIIVEAPDLRLAPEVLSAPFAWDELFGDGGRVEIEIGIGKGRFLLAAAAAHPETRFLGIEWANKYLRIAEARAVRRGLTNVRFGRLDASELMPATPPSSVAAFYVFYPDPWPKKRHQKRRFLRPQNVEQLARVLIPGGWLHVATDHTDYWTAIEPLLDGHASFERQQEFGGPEFPVPLDRPLTNYEEKYGRAGRRRHRATWRRRR